MFYTISQSIDIYSYPRRIQKIFSRISTLAQKQRFRVSSGENTELKKHRYISVKPLPKQQEKDSWDSLNMSPLQSKKAKNRKQTKETDTYRYHSSSLTSSFSKTKPAFKPVFLFIWPAHWHVTKCYKRTWKIPCHFYKYI